ncbi:MAG: zinc ribbon domain-containing protein [Actinomycetota bacterium]|nr:zinc ribbon domain-containing protein [Actinomycetota bacterium]
MPLYEYRCGSCGHRLELIQRMGEAAPGPCPECGGELKRVYGRVAVRFSGWGFSKTDALLPEGRRRNRDFKQLQEKAREITEGR